MVYDLVLTIILEYLFVPERSERNGYKYDNNLCTFKSIQIGISDIRFCCSCHLIGFGLVILYIPKNIRPRQFSAKYQSPSLSSTNAVVILDAAFKPTTER